MGRLLSDHLSIGDAYIMYMYIMVNTCMCHCKGCFYQTVVTVVTDKLKRQSSQRSTKKPTGYTMANMYKQWYKTKL